MRTRTAVHLAIALWAPAALAQGAAPGTPAPAAEPRGLGFFSGEYAPVGPLEPRIRIEPFAWYVSPGGDVGLSGSPLVATEDLSIDDPRLAPGVEVHLHHGLWRLSLLGALTSQHGGADLDAPASFGALSASAGERLVTEIDLDIFEIRGAYRVWGFATDPDEQGVPALRSTLEGVVGVRGYDYSLSVDRIVGPAGRASGDMQHAEPIAGFKWAIEFEGRYTIDLASNFGYLPEVSGQSSSSLDITVGFRYAPVPWAAAQIGYRLLVFDLESDDVEAEGALAGLYGGVSLQF